MCEGTVWYTSDYCPLCCGLAWPCLLERDNASYHLFHNATDATFVICPTPEGLYRQTSDRCDFERSRLAVGSVKAATHICKFHAVHYERGSTHVFFPDDCARGFFLRIHSPILQVFPTLFSIYNWMNDSWVIYLFLLISHSFYNFSVFFMRHFVDSFVIWLTTVNELRLFILPSAI